jgi:hypothetical protein
MRTHIHHIHNQPRVVVWRIQSLPGYAFHRKFAVVLSLLLLLGPAGCIKEASVEVFNNSNSTIQLHLGRITMDVPPAASIEKPYGQLAPGFSIEINKIQYQYVMPPVSRTDTYELWKHHRSRDILRTQIEADGSIYVVRPEATFPVLSFPKQPAGFPLKPQAPGRGAEGF